MKLSINELWERIKAHEGEVFTQKRGQKFTYTINPGGGSLTPSITNRDIGKKNFEEALKVPNLKGPGQINDLQGPSFVYAIITDDRMKN